jgi:hypothetical protein
MGKSGEGCQYQDRLGRLLDKVRIDGADETPCDRAEDDAMAASIPNFKARVCQTPACGLILMVGAAGPSIGQTKSPAVGFETAPTNVLTMAPNGSWGAATNDSVGAPIAAAIADCRKRSRQENGCGAWQMTMRVGWSFGIRCGDKNILVVERRLMEVEQAAIDQEIKLRRQ